MFPRPWRLRRGSSRGKVQRRGIGICVLKLLLHEQPHREASYPGLFYSHTFTLYRRGRSLPVPAKEQTMIKLTVETLYNGGVAERLMEELRKALDNISDPNTPAKKARKVKLEMSIKPNEGRNLAEVTVATSSTLCAPEPIETTISIGKDPRTGELGAEEILPGENPEQQTFPDTMTKGKITNLYPDRLSAAAGN